MIEVEGVKLVLTGSDGLLLKELSYLISMVKSRMASQGIYEPAQINDAVENAVSNADLCRLDELRIDARLALESEHTRRNMKI